LTTNASNLLALEAEQELQKANKKNTKYEYVINRNLALGKMKNRFVDSLMDVEVDLDLFCENIKKLMIKNKVPKRHNRTVHRKRPSNRKYHMNIRRSI
jgi:hypothetical protein